MAPNTPTLHTPTEIAEISIGDPTYVPTEDLMSLEELTNPEVADRAPETPTVLPTPTEDAKSEAEIEDPEVHPEACGSAGPKPKRDRTGRKKAVRL